MGLRYLIWDVDGFVQKLSELQNSNVNRKHDNIWIVDSSLKYIKSIVGTK